jgi:hypothetical protein
MDRTFSTKAQIGELRNSYRIIVGKPGGKRTLWRPWRRREDNFKDAKVWTGMDYLRIRTSDRFCEHDYKPSGSLEEWNFFHQLNHCHLRNKISAPRVSQSVSYLWTQTF